MTVPQTAADAAERVQRWRDAWMANLNDNHVIMAWLGTAARRHAPDDCPELTIPDVDALLAERTQMAAELEQVRGDWLTQAAQLNRIAGMVGHALILRACDDATPEEVRLALARACEDVHGVIGESEATRAQQTERYLVMCANLLNDHVLRERDGLAEHNGEMRNEREVLLAWLDELGYDALAVQRRLRKATSAAPDATGDTQTGERRADGKRTPEQWCAEYGIDIADPDGWRNAGDPAWDEPITLPDFLRRAAVSTTRGLTPDVWNRLSREAHEAADAEATASAARGATEHGAAPEGSVS